jgi:hypothetical protein
MHLSQSPFSSSDPLRPIQNLFRILLGLPLVGGRGRLGKGYDSDFHSVGSNICVCEAMNPPPLPRKKIAILTIVYLLVNLAGFLLFIFFVNKIENGIKAEQRDYADFGDSLIFLVTGFPVFLVCFLINFIWGCRAIIDAIKHKLYERLIALLVVVAVWCISWWIN